MKIVFVNTMYPPEIVGGAEVSVALLAEALAQRGHQVVVVCLHRERGPVVGERDGVRVYRVPIDNFYWPFENNRRRSVLRKLAWHLRDTWNQKAAHRFADILDEENPDVVHTNNLSGFSVSVWREARQRGIRIVHTLRDYSLICKRSTLFDNGKTCDRRCLSCAVLTSPYKRSSHFVDAVASNSRWVRDRHIGLGYFSKVPAKVVYNIANLAEIGQTARLEQGDMVFGFIGRIEPEKGIDVVLRAASRLPATGWRLRIAGIGAADYVDALKAKNHDERIEWLGFLPSQDFYRSVDVCLISSVWPEPLPRTLIESIAAGRATICSTAGGIPEISMLSALVGVYEPTDDSQLALLMLKAMEDAPRWRATHPMSDNFIEQFSSETIVNEYLELYGSTPDAEVYSESASLTGRVGPPPEPKNQI